MRTLRRRRERRRGRPPFVDPAIRPLFALLLLSLLGFALLPARSAQAPQPAEKPPETRTVETVAPGVEHIAIRRGDSSDKLGVDRWAIHALVVDPSRIRLELGRAMDEGVGTEPARSIAARHGALAAVNGGYFRTAGLYRGEPAGLLEVSGRVLSEPSRKRPGLAVANSGAGVRAAVVAVDFHAEIKAEDGATRPVDGVNRPRETDELILFTPDFHRTTLTGPGGVEAVLVDGMVTAVRDGEGSAAIPEGGCVLSASG
ncbi:MAG TPA: hypothetical protein VMS75_08930, partial [Terriglobales bacterium]|nr:hypothetical protein [Terriglobales bacterium]